MSERPTSNAGRLDNWDVRKTAHEQQQWEESLYAEAGSTDFSDEAKARADEAQSYEDHMAALSERDDTHDTIDEDRLDAIDRTIQGDARLRRMAMLASEISGVASHMLSENDDADRLVGRMKDKEDKLQELLEDYMENGEASEHEKDEIMNRIIAMTRNEEPEQVSAADQEQDEGDTTESSEYDAPRLTADEIRTKRAQMVKSGIKALDVGNMSDDEIDSYHLVESAPEEDEDDSSADEEAEALQRIADGESMLDVTEDLSTRVDTGDDLEEIEDEEEDETEDDTVVTVDTRNRRQRALAELRGLWDNRRSPYSYLHARMTNARAARATARAEARANGESSVDRRAAIAGLVATAAVVGTAIYFARRGEESPITGTQGGTGVEDGVNDNLNGSHKRPAPEVNDNLNGSHGLEDRLAEEAAAEMMPEKVTVHEGDGEIKVAQSILAEMGIDVDTTEAERIAEQAGVDLLVGDKNYDDAASKLNRIGGQAGEYTIQPGAAEALKTAAQARGH